MLELPFALRTERYTGRDRYTGNLFDRSTSPVKEGAD